MIRIGIDLGAAQIEVIVFAAAGRKRVHGRSAMPGDDYAATLDAWVHRHARLRYSA